jgi:uncharacterized protein DUF2786
MDNVIDKIRKLLALSKSANPHEAANAAARAAELMFEHKIEAADLEIAGHGKRPMEAVTEETLLDGEWRAFWKGTLADGVARSMSCRVYWYGPWMQIIGRKSDVNTVRYLFGFLVLEIERMATEGWTQRSALVAEHGTKWKNAFRWGAVHAIGRRLYEQSVAREAMAHTGALVLVRRDEAAVEDALQRHKLGKPISGTEPSSRDGYSQGERAGREMQMSGAHAAIGGSKDRLHAGQA